MDISDIELAELRKKAHAFDSEQGRLQKTQQELEQERAQRVEMEKRFAAAQQATQPVPDERALAIFGPDGVSYLQNMLKPLEQIGQQINSIGKKFEERDASETQAKAARAFQEALDTKLADRNLPGFGARLRGDLAPEWNKFVEARPSVRRAQSDGDVEAVSDVIATFIQQNKELVVGAGYSPQSVGGMSPAVKCKYSETDYMRDVAALDRQRDNCVIDPDKHKAEVGALYERYVAAQEEMERAQTQYGLV